jgi:hypothetical protein
MIDPITALAIGARIIILSWIGEGPTSIRRVAACGPQKKPATMKPRVRRRSRKSDAGAINAGPLDGKRALREATEAENDEGRRDIHDRASVLTLNWRPKTQAAWALLSAARARWIFSRIASPFAFHL